MIREKVKIVVVSKGHEFSKVVDIISDGSYNAVDCEVVAIVNRDWDGLIVDRANWFYV